MIEEFDIFDANMHPVAPFKAARGVAHQQALWHQVFHCWVMRRMADGAGSVFLQFRGKDGLFSKSFDVSAAGHLLAGETPMDGIREMEEELGLVADPAKLFPLGIYKQATDHPEYNYYNREFCHTFFYETELSPQDCKPQESEVDGLFEISIADALALFSGKTATVEISGIMKQDGQAGYQLATHILRIEDMCNYHDRCVLSKYYLRVFTLADHYFKGLTPLFI